ncbi:hypothetical protein [Streptomyces syringium]|uniref:hypothetical protein n=1 Tax=Streptomyces syringium TaxID=76729 RepID=UPI0037D42D0B
MSFRDNILARLRASEDSAIGDMTPEALLGAYHAEVLAEAVEAARGEYLTDSTGDPGDEAYNRGVSDAIAAVEALAELRMGGGHDER